MKDFRNEYRQKLRSPEEAVAVVKDGKEVLSLETVSQTDIHTLYGGVVPEIASRAHLEVISELTEKALKPVGLRNTDAVAVTYAPGLIGSLLVGVSFAKSLAYAHKLPLIPVHHIKAMSREHILHTPNSNRRLLRL